MMSLSHYELLTSPELLRAVLLCHEPRQHFYDCHTEAASGCDVLWGGGVLSSGLWAAGGTDVGGGGHLCCRAEQLRGDGAVTQCRAGRGVCGVDRCIAAISAVEEEW